LFKPYSSGSELSTWELLSREHYEVLSKIQLLEKASINLLKERTKDLALGKALKLQKDFLDLFKAGLMRHFMVEEEALFPMLRVGGETKLRGSFLSFSQNTVP